VGYEGGRLVAANLKAQGGGWITTLSCKERGEVDRNGTGSSASTGFGKRDVERSNDV
jgi:hypothetical protein